MARTGIHYGKKCLRGDNSVIYRVGVWFLFTIIPLIAIYLYTKVDLIANSSFKVICRTWYRANGQTDRRTDGQTKRRLYASPFGEHNNSKKSTNNGNLPYTKLFCVDLLTLKCFFTILCMNTLNIICRMKTPDLTTIV